MKKISTVRVNEKMIFKGHKLTIGLDLGDRWSCYCVLEEAGKVLLEQELPTTPEAMKQTFERIPRSLMALETGTHSPWVQEIIAGWGHEVLVANPRLMEGSKRRKRKNDRIDANKLARLGEWIHSRCTQSSTAVGRCARTWCCCERGTRWWRRGRS